MTIDYDRMNKVYPKQKAALTRAMNKWRQARLDQSLHATFDTRPVIVAAQKVEQVCRDTIREWDACGAWPDEWSRWEVALNDTRHYADWISLRDLQ